MAREPDFIAALRGLATHPAARGLADDAAVLDFGDEALVLTHDTMVEGVHWMTGQDPADVAWKLVAVNLSDLAAKGAEPLGVLLSYGLTGNDARFIEGLGEALAVFGVPLLGGDTVAADGPQWIGLTAVGRATHRPVPSRSGARPGDRLWITGHVGAAFKGLGALEQDGEVPPGNEALSLPFRRPVPRLAEGRALAPLVSAMMDVSDGLLLDANRMAEASGATFAIDTAAVPFAPAVRPDQRDDAMRFGDDYELLFTLPAGIEPPCPAQCIGRVLPRGEAPLLLDGTPVTGRLGWQHGETG